MSNLAAINLIQTARRNALVDYYTNYCIPQTALADGTALDRHVRTAEELYEYLLLDTRIGPEVMTSRVGEAISSLQLYINRCLGGIDPDVNNTAGSTMVKESKPGGFLYDWPDYNQAFSTWAGKERLQYYPSTYLSPELRYNKTELFKTLEQTINQGRVSDSRVKNAFQQYMLGFETLANLETISGYQAGDDTANDCKDTLYFIGRSKNSPHGYYWRSCDMAVRDDQGALTGGAWSQWLKLTVPTEEALDNMIRPCWFEGRLYVCWISQRNKGATGTDNVQATYEYYSNIWYLQEDGMWVSYKKERLGAKPSRFALVNDVKAARLEFYDISDVDWSKDFVIGDDLKYEYALPLTPGPIKFTNTNVKVEFEAPVVAGSGSYKYAMKFKMIFLDSNSFPGFIRSVYYRNGAKDSSNFIRAGYDYDNLITFGDTVSHVEFQHFESKETQKSDIIIKGRLVKSPSFYLDGGVLKATQLRVVMSSNIGVMVSTLYDQDVVSLKSSAAPYFVEVLQKDGVKGFLSYKCQTQPIERGGTSPIDFNGSYGLYFWELFFHSVFLIAGRYLIEQNYVRATQWHQYIFSAAGYRNTLGDLEMIDGKTRYWNVVPLQTDQSWNASIPTTVDPDVIAMNDPMHYKVAMFLSYVKTLIEHGDNCYRMQQRDYLGQAKMYYIQALQLLGPRPKIRHTNNWPNLTVGVEAGAISNDVQSANLVQVFKANISEGNGDFLPPYNDDLLTYWDKLEVRLFNLRNNLTLDGQPLVLPLYATPVSPTALQQQHGAGNGTGEGAIPNNQLTSEYRFPVLMDKARAAVSSAMQFGSALQSALQQRDSEYMTLLVQTQQQQITALTQELQVDNIASLTSGVVATTQALEGAKTRLSHYTGLYNDWISAGEQTAMTLRGVAGGLNIGVMVAHAVGSGLDLAPNTFGLACGGSRWGGAASIVAFGLQAAASGLETAAQQLDISEQYRRRRSDWEIQKEMASSEVKQLTAQIQSQNQQLAMAQKQRALYVQELSNLRAQYALQSNRFTGLELFNWMAGRLSSLYYQLYDCALALCLTAKAALGREIGAGSTTTLFTAPMWNDLYQGLLAGESLQLELQKMENTFLRLDQRGLEIQRTVSLNTQITRADNKKSFSAFLAGALQDTPVAAIGGVTVKMLNTDKLVITLAIDSLGLNGAYGSTGKIGRFKNISVTLPALLGPYQDVEATLSLGTEVVALSRGLDDSGMFMVDFNDPKYLPFEGDSTSSGMLILTFFNAGTGQPQRALVESLVDVIFQLRYTLKGH